MPTHSARTRYRFLRWLVVLGAACAPDAPMVSGPSDPDLSLNRGKKPGGEEPPPPSGPAGVCNFDAPATLFAGWTSVFSEDFTALSPSRWSIWYGGAWNDELQLYQASNLEVGGAGLRIHARRQDAVGPANPYETTPRSFAFTSGRLESFQHFSASRTTPEVRLSARLKLPPGTGMWPAFWSYGDPWPTQGEIDIVEARGQDAYTYQTAYWYGRRSGVNQVSNSASVVTSVASLTDCFHVYEVIWTRDALTFLLDGQVVDIKNGGHVGSMFGRSQRIVLNVAVGGAFFTNLDPAQIVTGTMEVDWVRVHTRSP